MSSMPIKGTTAPHNLESWQQQQTTTRNRTERIAISKPTETPQALSWIEDPYAVLSAIGKMEGVAWLERQEYVPRDSAEFAFTFFGALPLAERLRDIPSGGESSQYATVYGDGGTLFSNLKPPMWAGGFLATSRRPVGCRSFDKESNEARLQHLLTSVPPQ